MELRHVRSFLSRAKPLSFSRTAEIVHLSQPALSLQIQALEEEIGGKLFERDRRRTVLTAAGVAFQNEASGGLAQLEQAIQSARLALKGKMGVLRLGFLPTAGINLLPRLIREYRAVESKRNFFFAQHAYSQSSPNARGRLARSRFFVDAVRFRKTQFGSRANPGGVRRLQRLFSNLRNSY
jgi:DNA-binding transcriptional LysR family regulator